MITACSSADVVIPGSSADMITAWSSADVVIPGSSADMITACSSADVVIPSSSTDMVTHWCGYIWQQHWHGYTLMWLYPAALVYASMHVTYMCTCWWKVCQLPMLMQDMSGANSWQFNCAFSTCAGPCVTFCNAKSWTCPQTVGEDQDDAKPQEKTLDNLLSSASKEQSLCNLSLWWICHYLLPD